jgi:TonB family protein
VLGCVFDFACASALPAYPGPRRPAQTVALLHARDIDIEEVDGYRGGVTTSDFEIAPGTHSALVRIVARREHSAFASGSLRVCFVSEAGHTYAVIPRVAATGVGQGLWVPRIADETVNAWVPSKFLNAEATACSLQSMGPVFRIAWPLGLGNIRSNAMAQRTGYFEQVKAHVEPQWRPLEEYARRNPADPDLGMRKWATVLHVQLRADGSLMNVQIAVPSGSPVLDEIAVLAVQQAQPFPAPSPELVKQTGMTTIPLAFEIMSAGKSPEANP